MMETKDTKKKSWMYWELPDIKFGKYTISYMREWSTEKIWIQEEDAEWWEFRAKDLERVIWKFFDENF